MKYQLEVFKYQLEAFVRSRLHRTGFSSTPGAAVGLSVVHRAVGGERDTAAAAAAAAIDVAHLRELPRCFKS
jgi:hypothetical protein